jgi:hypothetical protein
MMDYGAKPGASPSARAFGPLLTLLVFLATAIVARPARAQSLMVQAVAAHSSHSLLGSQTGFGLVAGSRVGRSQTSLRFSLARLTGSARRTGVACAGLIMPGTCPTEPLRDDARTITGSVTLNAPVWRLGPVTFALGGGLALGWVRSQTHGLSSGHTLSADKTWVGLDAGVETAFRPWQQLPVALVLGAGLGAFRPMKYDDVVDGYTPLDASSSLTRLWLGVAWYPRPQ